MTKLSPMMERYHAVKAQHPGAMLLFRMGDFYELFFEDAQNASRVLGLTLTSRDKNSENPVPMAGFPWHQLDTYLQKLIHSGFRAAICDQVEDPKKAKGLVRREVTRVVTPGTLTDDQMLDPLQSNFLASLAPSKTGLGLAWLELSTGRFQLTDIAPAQLQDELARIRPAECLIPESAAQNGPLAERRSDGQPIVFTTRPDWCFARDECRRLLNEHFGTKTLEGFDVEDTPAVTAAGALLEYVRETSRSALPHILRLEYFRRQRHMIIDEATRRSLELTQTIRDNRRDFTLLGVLDQTCTPMGSRLLSEWIASPLADIAAINTRQDAVAELLDSPALREDLRDLLKHTWDVQRLTSRVATGRCSPRDLICLARTLEQLPRLRSALTQRSAARLQQLELHIELCPEVHAAITNALVEDPPPAVSDGGVIRPGFSTELDEFRDLMRGGRQWMAAYQAREIERTGISSLKIGFNKVFGYYLEVTAANIDKVPADYIRKQTLKNQERFITPELKEYEDKVLRAEDRARSLELELFNTLREQVALAVPQLLRTAEALAEIDVLTALANVAANSRYCRPTLEDTPVLDIRDGRHPVLDRLLPAGQFVPNDVRLGVQANSGSDPGSGRVQIITGPNMAGKSTYIRQAALITVMAQIGSFVPAKSARIGLADRVFARVGASDELARGQSTFMVEMTETARILNAATSRSLVILDEIGRGTSTYDGISLAWAITEFLHDETGCRTMFATHYHELTDLATTLKHASNWNVAVRESNDDVVFLHRIIAGAAGRSYGIHVAKIAGVPGRVTERATAILASLENEHLNSEGRPRVPDRETPVQRRRQKSLFESPEDPLLDELRNLEVDHLTPLQALQELHRLRQQLSTRSN
ncbi:MAG: mismatch repair protein MutS [Planctomycetota bacterium]|jgi:DNA mismatch repair protein MutS